MRKGAARFFFANHFIVGAEGKSFVEPQNFFRKNFVVRRQKVVADKIINEVRARRIKVAYAANLNPRRFIRRNLQSRAAFGVSAQVNQNIRAANLFRRLFKTRLRYVKVAVDVAPNLFGKIIFLARHTPRRHGKFLAVIIGKQRLVKPRRRRIAEMRSNERHRNFIIPNF